MQTEKDKKIMKNLAALKMLDIVDAELNASRPICKDKLLKIRAHFEALA